ncbi:hypothetical protein [Kocuria sabuli]|uniref:hypothetical protein n=1 Tax=Kocuria sabuli TaxID=3071448 RepID=UPI0034D48427
MSEQQRVNIGKQHPASYRALITLSSVVEESAAAAGSGPAIGRVGEDPYLTAQWLRVLPSDAHP